MFQYNQNKNICLGCLLILIPLITDPTYYYWSHYVTIDLVLLLFYLFMFENIIFSIVIRLLEFIKLIPLITDPPYYWSHLLLLIPLCNNWSSSLAFVYLCLFQNIIFPIFTRLLHWLRPKCTNMGPFWYTSNDHCDPCGQL